MEDYKKAQKHNEEVDKELSAYNEEMRHKHGDIVPRDYPKEDKDKWDAIYNKTDRSGMYPFSVENVQEFAEFAEHSGGFKIC
jgi:hypothetical protein